MKVSQKIALDRIQRLWQYGQHYSLLREQMGNFAGIFSLVGDFSVAITPTLVALAFFVTIASKMVEIFNIVDFCVKWFTGSKQRELVAKKKFEVAYELSRATLEIRDVFKECRAPLPAAREFSEKDDYLSIDRKEHINTLWHVYDNRWMRVSGILQEFDAKLLDAEVLLGSNAKVKSGAEQLHSCAKNLRSAISLYIKNEGCGGEFFEKNKKLGKKTRYILGYDDAMEEDKFSKIVEKAVADIDRYVRPYVS